MSAHSIRIRIRTIQQWLNSLNSCLIKKIYPVNLNKAKKILNTKKTNRKIKIGVHQY